MPLPFTFPHWEGAAREEIAIGTNATDFIMFQVGAGVRWNLEYFFVVLSSLVRSMLLMSDMMMIPRPRWSAGVLD